MTAAKSLEKIFNDFFAESIERFPQMEGRLLILDMNQFVAYGTNDIDLEKTRLNPETARKFLGNHPTARKQKANKDESSYAIDETGWRAKVKIIFSNERIPENEFKNVTIESEKNLLFVLDHELGHLALKDGIGKENTLHAKILRECLADAYAVIRHYQRFGMDSDCSDLRLSPHRRTRDLAVCAGKEHFTTYVTDEIIRRRHLIDFDRLDPQQTADLARRFVLEYAPPAPLVEDIYAIYGPVATAAKSDWLKVLVETVLDPEIDYHAFKFGHRWLMRFLEERTYTNGTTIDLPKSYLDLDEAMKKVKEREFKFAQEEILFNMPIVAAPANQNQSAPPKIHKSAKIHSPKNA